MPIIVTNNMSSRDGLNAEYLFTGNANDTSGNNLNGTLFGSPSLSTPKANALNLGNNKYMQIADNNLLSFTDGTKDLPFSISFKVRIESIVFQDFAILIHKRDSNSLNENAEWQIAYFWGDIYGYLGVSFSLIDKSNGSTINVRTNEQLTFGVEYNIVCTYNGNGSNTGLSILVDGADKSNLRGGAGTYTRMHNTSSSVIVGRAGWSTSAGFFNGYIDDIKIFNKVLYNRIISRNDKIIDYQIAMPKIGLIGEWLCRNYYDTSGNDINGTPSGDLQIVTGRKGVAATSFFTNTRPVWLDLGDNCDVGLNSLSISAWVKWSTAQSITRNCINKMISATPLGSWGLYASNATSNPLNKYQFMFRCFGTTLNQFTVFSDVTVTNNWVHIVCIADRQGTMKMYINNSLQSQEIDISPYSNVNMNTIYSLRIGGTYSGSGAIEGNCSNIRLYNRVLSIDEISILYNEKE